MNKKTIYLILFLIFITILFLVFNFLANSVENNNNQNVVENKKTLGEMPKFILGEVKQDNNNFYITVGNENKKVLIDQSTVFIKQVKDGIGYKNIGAVSEDIKTPVKIVVYYTEDINSSYKATKIQILDF